MAAAASPGWTAAQPGRHRGASVGVALGAAAASLALDARQDHAHAAVVLGLGAEDSGPDFGAAGPVVPAPFAARVVAGDAEQLYGGTFRSSACRRADLRAYLTRASTARTAAWMYAAGSDV